MDIDFPPHILAKKTFIVTFVASVLFIGAAYAFVISKDLAEEQPDREREGAELHADHGVHQEHRP